MCWCGCSVFGRLLAGLALLLLGSSIVFLLAAVETSAALIGPWLCSIGATLCIVSLEIIPACTCGCCVRFAHSSRGCARSHAIRFAAYGGFGAGGIVLGSSAAGFVAEVVASEAQSSASQGSIFASPDAYRLFSVFATMWALAGFSLLCLASLCAGVAMLRGEAGPYAPSQAPAPVSRVAVAAVTAPQSPPLVPFGLSLYKAPNPFSDPASSSQQQQQQQQQLDGEFGGDGMVSSANPFSASAPAAADDDAARSTPRLGSNPFTTS